MKKFLKLFGIIALVAIIGFTMIACSDGGDSPGAGSNTGTSPNPTPTPTGAPQGSGTFTGKDVLGNSYSLSAGSSAARSLSAGNLSVRSSVSRSVLRNDRINLDVRGRDGTTRQVRGTVTNIAGDGTLTIQADGSSVTFTANVNGDNLNTVVANDPAQPIPFTSGGSIVPRTFNNIYLRATRWSNQADGSSGENWGSGRTILERDFPTNISRYYVSSDRYSVTIKGTTDVTLNKPAIEVQGLKHNDEWEYIGGVRLDGAISEGSFNITKDMVFWANPDKGINDGDFYDLLQYKEVIVQFQNTINYNHPSYPADTINDGTIPAEIADQTIMATISDFSISIKDKTKSATGNMPDWVYGINSDGFSIQYNAAVWHLTDAADVNKVKTKGIFEVTLDSAPADLNAKDLRLVWQDPIRGLWWQDARGIAVPDPDTQVWDFNTGVTWDSGTKKLSIDLSAFINDPQFDSAQEIKLMIVYIGYWDNVAQAWVDGNTRNIDEFGIKGGNLN